MTTNSAGYTLIDTDTGDTAAATEIGTMSDQSPYANTGDNTLSATGDDGSMASREAAAVVGHSTNR